MAFDADFAACKAVEFVIKESGASVCKVVNKLDWKGAKIETPHKTSKAKAKVKSDHSVWKKLKLDGGEKGTQKGAETF